MVLTTPANWFSVNSCVAAWVESTLSITEIKMKNGIGGWGGPPIPLTVGGKAGNVYRGSDGTTCGWYPSAFASGQSFIFR